MENLQLFFFLLVLIFFKSMIFFLIIFYFLGKKVFREASVQYFTCKFSIYVINIKQRCLPNLSDRMTIRSK